MKARVNRVINAGIGYTIGNVLIKGISFLTIPIFTRLMVTSDYGVYNTYTAYVSIFAFVVSLGLDPTLKNAEYDYAERKESYLSTILILSFVPFFLMLVAILVLGKELSVFCGLSKPLMVLLVIQAEARAIINIYNIKLSLNYASKSYLKIAVFNTVVSIGLAVLLMLTVFTEERYMGRIIGGIIPLILVAFCILFTRVVRFQGKRFDSSMVPYALALGLPLVPHLLAQIVNSQFDRIMISRMVGFSESGIYSFTYNIAVILQIVYSSLDSVWGPWFFNRMNANAFTDIRKAAQKYTVLMVFLTVSLMTISREFIMLMAPEEYWEGVKLVPVLILGIFVLFLYTLPVGVEYFKKKTGYIAICSVATALCNIVLNYFGIRIWGYMAAAYTTLISYVILFTLHWTISRKLIKEKIFNLMHILMCLCFVVVWTIICTAFADQWLIRYGVYLLFVGVVIAYFKNDIVSYVGNMKKRKGDNY